MKTLEIIAGYTQNDRQRNATIREKCQTDDTVRCIRERRREWNKHVDRVGSEGMAKRQQTI